MQRIKNSFFSDSETLQVKTVEMSHQIMSLIKESDLKLKELSRAETNDSSSEQSKSQIPSVDKLVLTSLFSHD